MAIKINDIPPEGLTVEIDEAIDLFDKGEATTPFSSSLTIRPSSGGAFHVTGKVTASVDLECSRCLKRFTFPVKDAAMDFDLLPEGSLQQGAEHELGREELDTEFYRGDEIEPKEYIREQVLLALPMVPVHREECKGLCPVCGADWNERTCDCPRERMPEKENPFAALKKIFNPEKE